MRATDQVILVPGFFGFGSFGRPGRPHILYFDHVIKALVAARPELAGRVHIHEPPPMGSLEARVRSLQDAVLQRLGGALLRGDARGPRRPRIHLVGHSTGGVDARLLANPRYRFHGEDRALRGRLLQHLGTVVALSAPQHGTPIAESFMRGLPRLVLEGMSLATIMANAGRVTKRLGMPGIGLAYTLFQAVRPRPDVNGPVVDLLTGMDEETARQIERFRGMVMSDTRILRDLAPARMAALNERLGDRGARLVEIVTVAPRPSWTRGGLRSLDRRAVYALCHAGAARRDFHPRTFPTGPWIAARAPGTEREQVEDAPLANDGIVPASSQTLAGRAARIVLADHLDVVGHYEGRWNTTLFKSGAGCGRREFAELWRFVAAAL
jgi:triacylglycerol lipase